MEGRGGDRVLKGVGRYRESRKGFCHLHIKVSQ